MRYFLPIIILCLLCFTACNSKQKQADEKPVLTVTIEPLRFFTQAIAGDKYKVVSMVPAGSNPETYDPTPQQLIALSQSAAYLRIGYIGFEQAWMERIKTNVPNILVFDASKNVELMQGHSHDSKVAIEPHIWNSTRNARVIAGNICRALCELDTVHTSYYQARLDSVMLCIDRTDQSIKALLPQADSAFLIYHPALTYFARDYGLTQICIEEEGKEPSPAQLQQLIRKARNAGVRIIFVQQEFDTRNAQVIAKELGAQTVSINPLSYEWEKEMVGVAQALVK